MCARTCAGVLYCAQIHDDGNDVTYDVKYCDGDKETEVENYRIRDIPIAESESESDEGPASDSSQAEAPDTAGTTPSHQASKRSSPSKKKRRKTDRASSHALTKGSSSGFTGVYSMGYAGKRSTMTVRAVLRVHGRAKHIGTFETNEEAARAYDAAAIQHGLPAVNFPASSQSVPPPSPSKAAKHSPPASTPSKHTQRTVKSSQTSKPPTPSKYTGVSANRGRTRWVSYILIDAKKKHLGTFDTEQEAARVHLLWPATSRWFLP